MSDFIIELLRDLGISPLALMVSLPLATSTDKFSDIASALVELSLEKTCSVAQATAYSVNNAPRELFPVFEQQPFHDDMACDTTAFTPE